MTIKSNAGGYMKIPDLGITIGPGCIIDLDTLCTSESQKASKDLKKLISMRFLLRVSPSTFKGASFTASDLPSVTTVSNLNSLRKVVFVQF